jgi:hypothetical protein
MIRQELSGNVCTSVGDPDPLVKGMDWDPDPSLVS